MKAKNIKNELPPYGEEVYFLIFDSDEEVYNERGKRTHTDHNGEHYESLEDRTSRSLDNADIVGWFYPITEVEEEDIF
jgi:hypothetical protein